MLLQDIDADVAMRLRSKREALAFFVQQASPQVLAVSSIAFLIARIGVGEWHIAEASIAIAMPASWHIQERLIHEYLLHKRAQGFLGRPLRKRISEHHRRHHLDPWRTATLFITTSAHWFNIPVLFALLLAITRDIGPTLTGSFAYVFTLLCYEWTHLLIHTSYTPRSNWYRRRWQNHRLHHFRDSRYWFGITSPLWDDVLRSRPDPTSIPTRKNWRGPNPLE